MLLALVLLPLAGCVLVLAAPERMARLFGVGFTAATLGVVTAVMASFDYGRPGVQRDVNYQWIPTIGVRFRLGVDGISLPLVALTALLSFLCAVYTLYSLPEPGRPRALTAVLLLLEVGMIGTFLALDLIVFFVFFETVLIPMYFLIRVWGTENRRYASVKFILFTLLGSAAMLLGFLGIYAATGTFDMVALAAHHGGGISHQVQDLCFLGLFLGFAVKTPMWPLHTWLPDAHTEAPTVGSVLLAGVLLKMGTYGFIRIALPELPRAARDFAPYLGVFAVIGICYGALCCLVQRDLKRLIAFSSVGHMGFVLLGIATLSATGINAALFGNVAHGIITGLLFFLAGALKDRYHTAELRRLGGGLYAKAPLLGALLAFVAIASLGLPGLAGFWGEMLAMLGAFSPGAGLDRNLFLALMATAGVGAIFTTVYFVVMLRRVNTGAVDTAWRGSRFADVTTTELVAWAPLLVLTVVLGLWPRLVLGVTDVAVKGLLPR